MERPILNCHSNNNNNNKFIYHSKYCCVYRNQFIQWMVGERGMHKRIAKHMQQSVSLLATTITKPSHRFDSYVKTEHILSVTQSVSQFKCLW